MIEIAAELTARQWLDISNALKWAAEEIKKHNESASLVTSDFSILKKGIDALSLSMVIA